MLFKTEKFYLLVLKFQKIEISKTNTINTKTIFYQLTDSHFTKTLELEFKNKLKIFPDKRSSKN